MERKHTPGPWVEISGYILTEKTRHEMPGRGYEADPDAVSNITVASVATWQDDITDAENQANGKLMAAAPDLLDALEELLEEAESLRSAYNVERESDGWDAEEEDESFAKARAAIAKAKGVDWPQCSAGFA